MATIGLSKPYFALYAHNGTTLTPYGGGLLGAATQLDLQLNSGDSNILRADNGPREQENTFTGGTIEYSVDDLSPEVIQKILGVETAAISAQGVNTPGAKWLKYNDNQSIPYLMIGGIAKKKWIDRTYYKALLFLKVQMKNLDKSITTQGETIDWQVPTIKGDLFQSDMTTHDWHWESSLLNTEEEAEAALRAEMNITAASITPALSALTIGALTLDPTFAAGTTVYTTSTTNAKDAVTATAVNESDNVEIKVNGEVIDSGDDAEWITGSNLVEITVTTASGAQRVYIVTVTKGAGA